MLRKLREHEDEGFTLIELLVVVIIIGILAAIAIPVFLNQREKAWESAVKSDLRNAATAQETYFTENNNYSANVAGLDGEGFNQGSDITFANDGSFLTDYGAGTGYCMQAAHDSAPAEYWYFSSDEGEPLQTAC